MFKILFNFLKAFAVFLIKCKLIHPILIYGTKIFVSFFAARNNTAEEEREKTKDSNKGNKANAIEYDDDDEIDEFKEVMKQLEPKYRRYANWRI